MQMEHIHCNKGFTLIEVLIAMAILTIGILSLFTMQIHSVQGNTKANRQTMESCLSSDQIEQLLSKSYNDTALKDIDGDGTNKDMDRNGIDDGGNNFGLDDVTIATADGNLLSPDGLYTIFWNVAVDCPMPNLKTIRVYVKDNNRPQSIPISYQYIKDDVI